MTTANKIEIKASSPQEIAAVLRSLAAHLAGVAANLEAGKSNGIFGERPYGLEQAAAELASVQMVPVLTSDFVEAS